MIGHLAQGIPMSREKDEPAGPGPRGRGRVQVRPQVFVPSESMLYAYTGG